MHSSRSQPRQTYGRQRSFPEDDFQDAPSPVSSPGNSNRLKSRGTSRINSNTNNNSAPDLSTRLGDFDESVPSPPKIRSLARGNSQLSIKESQELGSVSFSYRTVVVAVFLSIFWECVMSALTPSSPFFSVLFCRVQDHR